MTNSEARKRHATPPTPDVLDAIRARVEAATEGPWEHSLVSIDTVEDEYVVQTEAVADVVCRLDRAGEFIEHPMASARADAEFIAHARTDIPLLLAALDEARAEVERLHSWSGLMELLEEHWPADIFPTRPEDPARDAGPRIVSLIRNLDAAESARDAAEGAIERVRELADEWRTSEDRTWICSLGDQLVETLAELRLAPVTTDETEGGGA